MYKTKYYSRTDTVFINEFIDAYPFAIMVSRGDDLIATHIPILKNKNSKELQLYGHIANHNEQLKYLRDESTVLLIFNGPHGYISSSWYDEADISTWDYAAVHVHARIRLQSEAELVDSLRELVQKFEKPQESPVLYDDIPADILKSHLPEITGFWLNPYKIEAISKMSQNRSKEDVASVVEHLSQIKETENLRTLIQKENEEKNT